MIRANSFGEAYSSPAIERLKSLFAYVSYPLAYSG